MFIVCADFDNYGFVAHVEDVEKDGEVQGYIEFDGELEDRTANDDYMYKLLANDNHALLNIVLANNLQRFHAAYAKHLQNEKEQQY